jgi:transaldolase
MPNTKATAGPWFVIGREICSEADGRHSCVSRAHLSYADARLIAQAPEMAALLDKMLGWWVPVEGDKTPLAEMFREARTILRRVRGEE